MSLKNSKKIIIKIGSSLLVDNNKKVRKKWLDSFAKDIKNLKKKKQTSCNCKFWCNSPWLYQNEI